MEIAALGGVLWLRDLASGEEFEFAPAFEGSQEDAELSGYKSHLAASGSGKGQGPRAKASILNSSEWPCRIDIEQSFQQLPLISDPPQRRRILNFVQPTSENDTPVRCSRTVPTTSKK